MNESDSGPQEKPYAILGSLHNRVQRLTVAVVIMALAMLLQAAYVFGEVIDYFAFDPLLYGSVSIGSAVLGFACGWFARRRA